MTSAPSSDLGGQLGVDQVLQRPLQRLTEQLPCAVVVETGEQISVRCGVI